MNEQQKLIEASIEKLLKQVEGYEQEIYEIEKKKDNLMEQVREYRLTLEKMKYHGMSKREYFKVIQGTQFTAGEYTITIGMFYDHCIGVETKEDDLEVRVHGANDVEFGTMKLSRQGDYAKGTRWYEKEYYKHDIPKKREKQYDEMNALRKKYGAMMLEGDINPVKFSSAK